MRSRRQQNACVDFDLRSWVRSLEWLQISRQGLARRDHIADWLLVEA